MVVSHGDAEVSATVSVTTRVSVGPWKRVLLDYIPFPPSSAGLSLKAKVFCCLFYKREG